MSFFRKYLFLVVGGGIALALLLLLSLLLFRFQRQYESVRIALQTHEARRDDLHRRNPFPSAENVDRIRDNLEDMEVYLDGLLTVLSAQQPEPVEMERAAFPAEIEQTTYRLRELAADRHVRLREDLAFGFARYAAGHLPVRSHVGRLVVQLRTIDMLCTLLLTSEISALIQVERDAFDTEAPRQMEGLVRRDTRPARTAPGTGVPEGPAGVEGLYTRERYTLVFLASEPALRSVLNRLAASPTLIVVRRLDLVNELALEGSAVDRLAARLQPVAERQRGGRLDRRVDSEPAAGQPLRLEDRVVAGRERIRVTMELDVYRFQHSMEPDTAEGSV
jgi:hypothetical protein